jgi:hypothetical protein
MNQNNAIKQPWLTLVRLVWIALSLYNLIPGLLNLPGVYHQLISLAPLPNQQGWTQTTFSIAVARTGLSSQLVAWIILIPILIKLLVFLSVGLFIFGRKSNEWYGLLVSFVLVSLCGTFTGNHFHDLILAALPPLWQVVANELGALSWLAFYMFLLLFPDGRFVPSWMRWVAVSLAGWFVLNDALNLVLGQAPDLIIGMFIITLALILIGKVHRYRRLSSPVERQQIRWFLFASMSFIIYATLEFFLVRVFPLEPQPGQLELGLYLVDNYLGGFIFLMIPIAIGIAIFRYRLWDIDLIIRRTLQYGLLTVLLGLVYFGMVVLLGQVFRALTGQDSPLVVVLSTLAIAALFTPLRRRLQNFIDRRFFRQKYNAEQAVATFATAARSETAPNALTGYMVRVVEESVQPEQVWVWLKDGKQEPR